MLTKRENLMETIRGGKPDRLVNQFEFMHFIFCDPLSMTDPWPAYGQENITDLWGVTRSFPENTPGPFPLETPDKICCPDVAEWKKYVKAPGVDFPDSMWEQAKTEAAAVNRREEFVTAMVAPGLFERMHSLLSIQEALVAFYEEPEAVKELIGYLEEWELAYAKTLCENLRPDCIYHHDDWGSQQSTFLSPDMFEEFFLESYKRIYGYYKSHGVEVIVHHSDSYAETLVPFMIEMGIDIWQGVMTSNDLPGMIGKYGGQITFMGGINSASVDHPGWTEEEVAREVSRACEAYGRKYFIPNTTMGGPESTFPGVYETVSHEIENWNRQKYGTEER